jgi:riboflavin kinase / FMN adenylyltransferase
LSGVRAVNLLHSIDALDDLPGPIHLAIGVFDGVHLGHQAVIRSALAQPGTIVVVTFDPHPSRVLRPDRTPLMLTSTRHKIDILRTLDVKNLLVIPFDDAFARTSARDFVRRLQSVCHPLGSVAVGSDWTFGHRAAGNVNLLRSLGVTVHAIDPVIIDGEMARSTLVRDAVDAGDFARAARLLGRPYTVLGRVISGRKLGRRLGFPTANLALENEQLPPDGVYAVRATLSSNSLAGVANLGLRPSIDHGQGERRLEVHLFDHEADIYGHDLEVEFVQFLRAEQAFASLDALKEQIARDAATARAAIEVCTEQPH